MITINLLYSFIVFFLNEIHTPKQNDNNKLVTNTKQKNSIHKNIIDSTYFDYEFIRILDELATLPYSENGENNIKEQSLNVFNFPKDSIPKYSNEFYSEKINYLNERTPINLVFNEKVKKFIELYTVKKRILSEKILGLSHYYFPLIEAILDRNNIPLEFKYLVVVESALNPKAVSKSGAKGLWQFMYSTGKIYGLQQNSYIDERMDPIKSTEAACKYLNHLYKIYGKWDLVLAAYNCGPGNVNKAIRYSRNKNSNYWDIYNYLPRETRGYVPAFIAVNYFMENNAEHNIFPNIYIPTYFEVDTLSVSKPIDIVQLANFINEPIELLKILNPSYKTNYIPVYSNKNNFVVIPVDKLTIFENKSNSIYELSKKQKSNDGSKIKFSEDRVIYRVRKGDYLGRIARRYKVSISSIRGWNRLKSNNIYVGQKLVLYPHKRYIKRSTNKNKITQNIQENKNYIYYVIQKGETLWDISKSKGIPVSTLTNLNNHLNYRDIKPGTKIILNKK